jgi:hypothetical protein
VGAVDFALQEVADFPPDVQAVTSRLPELQHRS